MNGRKERLGNYLKIVIEPLFPVRKLRWFGQVKSIYDENSATAGELLRRPAKAGYLEDKMARKKKADEAKVPVVGKVDEKSFARPEPTAPEPVQQAVSDELALPVAAKVPHEDPPKSQIYVDWRPDVFKRFTRLTDRQQKAVFRNVAALTDRGETVTKGKSQGKTVVDGTLEVFVESLRKAMLFLNSLPISRETASDAVNMAFDALDRAVEHNPTADLTKAREKAELSQRILQANLQDTTRDFRRVQELADQARSDVYDAVDASYVTELHQLGHDLGLSDETVEAKVKEALAMPYWKDKLNSFQQTLREWQGQRSLVAATTRKVAEAPPARRDHQRARFNQGRPGFNREQRR